MKKITLLLVAVLMVAVIAIPTLSKAQAGGTPVQIGGPVAGGYYSTLQPFAQYSGETLPVTPAAGGYYGPLKPAKEY